MLMASRAARKRFQLRVRDTFPSAECIADLASASSLVLSQLFISFWAGSDYPFANGGRTGDKQFAETGPLKRIRMNLDWNAIRPLNGGRDKGFEELCAQLARPASPAGSHFVRKGPPDAGVECYATLADGSEWGWQAKYFGHLGKAQ